MIGGYRIADFSKTVFTSGTAQTLKGMYMTVKNPFRKAILIEGLMVGELVYPSFFGVFNADSDNMVSVSAIGSNTVTITVTPADSVTVTITPANRSAETKTAVKAVKK